MSISKTYYSQCLYHFTHILNLESILKYGLLSTSMKQEKGIGHSAIAYQDIQDRRATMEVPCGPGGVVHDYVPLYFCIRSPMLLAVINNKIADEQLIIYLEFRISIIEKYPTVFTDASANTIIPPNFYADPKYLNNVDWEAVDTWKWGSQHDISGKVSRKQAKMAEVLVHRKLDVSEIKRIIVWNKSFKKDVQEIYKDANLVSPTIDFGNTDYYFINNGYPTVTGPFFIKIKYDKTVTEIEQQMGMPVNPRYKSMTELRNALGDNLGNLPETSELVNLESDNEVHTEDVGTHTKNVVRILSNFPEFDNMSRKEKLIIELAAYLHDIGKGPKSRWNDYNGKQQLDPDHPIKALPMLKRILIEEIENLEIKSVRLLCKLVCYHDIIGDITGRGRRIEELEEIVENEQELDMLITLGKADIKAVNPFWHNENKIRDVHRRVLATLQSRADENE